MLLVAFKRSFQRVTAFGINIDVFNRSTKTPEIIAIFFQKGSVVVKRGWVLLCTVKTYAGPLTIED